MTNKLCANKNCILHIDDNDSCLRGGGEWFQFADGTITSRLVVNGALYCDRCARKIIRASDSASRHDACILASGSDA